jgi:hypothetical protein
MRRALIVLCIAALAAVSLPLPRVADADPGGQNPPAAPAAPATPQIPGTGPTPSASAQPYSQSAAATAVAATLSAMVTRGKKTLDAALVPGLLPGDVISVDFSAWAKPAAPNRFSVNYATIGANGIQWWAPDKSKPKNHYGMDLFSPSDGAPPATKVSVTYDGASTPVFFIVVQDKNTSGMNGVRDDVNVNPQPFLTAATYASTAADKRAWIDDFISGLGSGAIDTGTGKANLTGALKGVGVTDGTAVAGCLNKAKGEQATCLEGLIEQSNNLQLTGGQSIGQALGAFAGPLAPYLAGISIIWNLIESNRGHKQHYEFLPGALTYNRPAPTSDAGAQVVQVPQVPQYAPPGGGQSDVVFFSVGRTPEHTSDPSTSDRPTIVSDADKTRAICATDTTVSIPLHLDKSSNFTHDVAYVVSRAGTTVPLKTLPLLHDAIAPASVQTTDIASLHGVDGYDVTMEAGYGFDSIATQKVRVALPRGYDIVQVDGTSPQIFPNVPTTINLSGDAIACAKDIDVNGARFPVTVTDSTHATATVTVADVGSGSVPIQVEYAGGAKQAGHLSISQRPPTATITYHSGDAVMLVHGSGLSRVGSIVVGGTSFVPDAAHSDDNDACFTAPFVPVLPANSPQTAYLHASAAANYSPINTPFTVGEPRPQIAPKGVATTLVADNFLFQTGVAGSTSTVKMIVTTTSSLPTAFSMLLRQEPWGATAGLAASRCAALVTPAGASKVNATKIASAMVLANFRPIDALQSNASSDVQVQIVDSSSHLASDWVPLPLTLVIMPTIAGIICPKSGSTCQMQGSGFALIAGVAGAAGSFEPVQACGTPEQSKVALECVLVPRTVQRIKLAGSDQVVTLATKALVRYVGVLRRSRQVLGRSGAPRWSLRSSSISRCCARPGG